IIKCVNTQSAELFELGFNFLHNEIERTEALGEKDIVLQSSAHVSAGADVGINRIIESLNEVLTNQNDVRIAIETMAGKGSEIGRTFEEFAQIIDGITHN
ncbi:deoxyribonuclease IV, partial [Staphylococcus pseudintermedius]|uniref:TIM barrel protein n=1 Tax=Staphylococcus pseudintermedius TaxID=283734 RepID=UPI000E38020F